MSKRSIHGKVLRIGHCLSFTMAVNHSQAMLLHFLN